MRFAALGLIAAVLVPASCHAQPIFGHANSLEYSVLNCDLLFIGRIKAVKGDLSPTVTHEVETTLKGPHQKSVKVMWPAHYMIPRGWESKNPRLLIAARFDQDLKYEQTAVLNLDDPKLEAFSAEFKVLKHEKEVLRVVRSVLKKHPGVTRVEAFSLLLPHDVVRGTRWGDFHGTQITVPVGERLQQWSLAHLRSDDYSRRIDAANALRFFRSAKNVERLKPLLSDPGSGIMYRAENNEGLEVRHFGVREAAKETFDYWGIDVAAPKLRQETLRLDQVTLVDLSNAQVKPQQIAKLRRFPNLESLFLWNVKVNAELIDEVRKLTSLRKLMLAGTNMNDSQLKRLAENASYRYLDLAGTPITDQALSELAKMKALEHVDLERTKITQAGIREFAKRRPTVKIESSYQKE